MLLSPNSETSCGKRFRVMNDATMPVSYTKAYGVNSASCNGVSSWCMVKGVYEMVMKNKLKEYPKLPIELSSTNDAMVVLERLRLRPKDDQSVRDLENLRRSHCTYLQRP